MSKPVIYISVHDAEITRVNKDLKLEGQTIRRIEEKAFNQAGKKFLKFAVENLSKKYSFTKRVLKDRIKLYMLNALKAKVFGGLWRLGLTRWKAKKTKKGVTYGASGRRQLREHAFIVKASKKSNSKVAFKRTGEFSIASKGRYAGKKREKLEKQYADIDDLFIKELDDLSGQFFGIFEREFNNLGRLWVQSRL